MVYPLPSVFLIVKYEFAQFSSRGARLPRFELPKRKVPRFLAHGADTESFKAVNIWIGNSHSVTALHRDNYENIYCQIIGSKDFVLIPPVATASVNERFLPCATYDQALSPVPDDPPAQVPFAVWDPDLPSVNTTEFSHLVKPARVRLEPGDMLYLPRSWYHKVSQTNSTDGICCSVNYCRSMART